MLRHATDVVGGAVPGAAGTRNRVRIVQAEATVKILKMILETE